MGKMNKNALAMLTVGTMLMTAAPTFAATTDTSGLQAVPQGVGSGILSNSDFFGGENPTDVVKVDIMMKVQNQDQLSQFINQTVTPGNPNYRKYLNVDQFKSLYAPKASVIQAVKDYLASFGIQSSVYQDNLVITATGTVSQFNQAFNVVIENASYKGKNYHGTKTAPQVPKAIANNILCVLGLSDYSNLASHATKQPLAIDDLKADPSKLASTPDGLMTTDLASHYNVNPLYAQGASGAGQTIGIVTLADFNPSDAYAYWNYNNLNTKPNRITKINVDGGSGLSEYDGSDETTLDVEQSGGLAPQADVRVYVGPNSDTGFIDAWAAAINDNIAHQISVSWGESETIISAFVASQMETPEYEQTFNQLFMQAAAQGISTFAAAGDAGAYDASEDIGTYNLSVDNPADSPYITAAGGTTLPFTLHSTTYNMDITVPQERAWGWDYLYPYFDARGLNNPDGWASRYFVGGGGGFSDVFATPDYQKGISGVNKFTATKQWTPSADYTSVTRDAQPTIVTGNGSGRNLPDLSMNADPYSGYAVYFNLPISDSNNKKDSGWITYGGTSFVAPQLAGLSALINSADNTQVGFWNPQIYRFANSQNSPLHPLNTTGVSNDNVYYTGTPGTIYNQATGLGTPDVAALAKAFK